MKQTFKTLLLALFALVTSTSLFTSCDADIAATLEGTWEGEMQFKSYYDGHYYYSNYTELEFNIKHGRTQSGYGVWVDYYSNAPWDYVANHTIWEVSGGVIYVHLVEDDYDIEIRDYNLDDDHFSGTVFYEGEKRRFRLRHTYSPNWNDYNFGGYYYGQRRSAEAADSTSAAGAPTYGVLRPDADGVVRPAAVELKERPVRMLDGE